MIDTTVCDLVADVRAATPSVAAERAIPALSDMYNALVTRQRRMTVAIQRRGQSASLDLKTTARDMRAASQRAIQTRRVDMSSVAGRLNALSPLATLSRGYSIARDADGRTLSSVADFVDSPEFDLILRDGTVPSRTR